MLGDYTRFNEVRFIGATIFVERPQCSSSVQEGVCLYGAPNRVIADQDRCYIISEFKVFCGKHNIQLHFIATDSNSANGQVERVKRLLKSLLTIIENDPNKIFRNELVTFS